MAWKAMRTDWSDEAQKRLTLVPGTLSGRPASMAMFRAMFIPCSPTWLAAPMITSSTVALSTAGTLSSRVLMMNPPRSSMRTSFSDPLKARPIGVRAVATMTASGIRRAPFVFDADAADSRPVERVGSGSGRAGGRLRSGLGGGRGNHSGFGDGGGGPAAAAHARELAKQGDGSGVVVPGTDLDHPVAKHPVHDLAAHVGSDDRQRPVVERADSARADIGVLGREVRAELAALPRPGVALLERHLVVAAVPHPDLEHALDVHLDHVLLAQAVLRLEELLEDGVVEGLGAEKPDVQREPACHLARLAGGHHRWSRGLAGHPDQGDLLRSALHGVGVGHGVRRVGVAGSGRSEDLVPGASHSRDGLPARPVALQVGDQRGVDVAVFHAPQQDGRDLAAVLAGLVDLGIGGARQHDVLGDAVHLGLYAGSAEHEGVDLGLPRAEPGAGPGAEGAALLPVLTPGGITVGRIEMEGLVDPVGVVVAEDVVRAGG